MQTFSKLMAMVIWATGAVFAQSQCVGTTTTGCLNGKAVSGVPEDAKPTSSLLLSHNLVSDPLPVYPQVALQSHTDGLVSALVILGKDGHVQNVLAADGPEPLLQASKDAILQWTYKPILLNGEPVRAMSTVFLSFTIEADSGQPKVVHIPFVARISGGVMARNRLTMVPPVYPAEARAKHIGGTVVIQVLIGEDGKILNASVVSGPEELRASSLEAVRQWTFKPYLLSGNPTPVQTTITFTGNMSAT